MTKFTTSLATLSLLAGSLTLAPAAALAQDAADGAGNTGTVLECRAFADEVGLKRVRGLCNAYYFADDPVGECIVLRDMGVLAEWGITQGECIDLFDEDD